MVPFRLTPVFSTTLAATPAFASKCLVVNVMPERLLSVISGILAGGDPLVSALSFVASITLLSGPFVLFCVFFGLLVSRWPFSS